MIERTLTPMPTEGTNDLPDLWDAEACAKWVEDECQQELRKLLGISTDELAVSITLDGEVVQLQPERVPITGHVWDWEKDDAESGADR
jgi:hypothetical protein